jgi:hypothetical protein
MVDSFIVKSHTFDPMNWTSTLQGESYKKENT